MKNLQKIKLKLMTNGVNIENDALKYLYKNFGEKFYNDDYITTTGIMIELGNNFYVTSHIDSKSSYKIILEQNNFILKHKKVRKSIKIWQPYPCIAKNVDQNTFELLKSNIAVSHFDRVRISPINGCNNHCAFCSMNSIKYKKNSIKDINTCLKYLLEDDRITHILISGGSPKQCDLEYLTKVYEYFCKNFPKYDFDVMTTPRGFDSYTDRSQFKPYIEHLKKIGVSGLSINLELYNNEICAKYCPEKYKLGKDNYFYFLKIASEIFGSQNVRSGLIVGLESKKDTLKAVEEICKCGCMPMLSPYIPYNNIGHYPSAAFLYDVYKKTKKIINKYNLNLAPLCAKCRHNTI